MLLDLQAVWDIRLEVVTVRNDGDAGFRNSEACGIGGGVKPNPLAGRNLHILVDDAAVQVHTGANMYPVEQDRIFDYGSFIHLDLREQDRMSDCAAGDYCPATEQGVNDLSCLPACSCGHTRRRVLSVVSTDGPVASDTGSLAGLELASPCSQRNTNLSCRRRANTDRA